MFRLSRYLTLILKFTVIIVLSSALQIQKYNAIGLEVNTSSSSFDLIYFLSKVQLTHLFPNLKIILWRTSIYDNYRYTLFLDRLWNQFSYPSYLQYFQSCLLLALMFLVFLVFLFHFVPPILRIGIHQLYLLNIFSLNHTQISVFRSSINKNDLVIR